MAAAEDWRTPEKRRAIIQQLEDALRNCAGNVPQASLQNPVGVEKSIYDSAKSGEEYAMNIRKVILMITRRPQPPYPAMQQQQPPLQSSQLMAAGASRPTVSAPMHGMAPSVGMGRPPLQQAYQPSPYPQHQPMQHGGGMTHVPSPHPGPYAPSPHPAPVMHPGMAPMHAAQRTMPPSNPMVQMAAPPQGPMAPYQVQPSHPVPIQATATYPPPPQGMYTSSVQQRYLPQMARPPSVVGGMNTGMVARAPGMQFQQTIHRYPYSGEGVNTGVQSVTAVPNPSFSSVAGPVRASVPPYTSPTSNVVQGVSSSSSPAPVPTPAAPTTQETATHPPNAASSSSNPPTPHPNLQVAPSPAPPTPLLPASPITSIGSPTHPTMTPEENEAYLRKLGELQRYLPLMSRMLNRLSKTPPDERRNDQYLKLRSLHNLLQDTNRRVPLQTLQKCGESLERMFGSHLKEISDAHHSHSSLEPPPSLPPTAKLPEFSRSQSLLEFKMIPSPPPTCNNLLETIQAKPLPPERLPPAKRQCNREEPLLSPSLKRELAHLEHFEIRHVSQDNKFDKSILLECSLVDEGLPQVPSLTICIPPTYPLASPQVDLAQYTNSSSFLKSVGKLLSEELVQSHSTYTLSFLLTSWMECVMRATTNELASPE